MNAPLFLSAIAAALSLSLVHGDAQAPVASTRRTTEFRGLTMGAAFSVKVVTARDEVDAGLGDVDRALRATLDRINRLMSTWDPDSELSRFNRSASLEPFRVSLETFEVLKWSLDLAALTGGALDVTVGPLVDAWGFGPGGPETGCRRTRRSRGCGRRPAPAGSN